MKERGPQDLMRASEDWSGPFVTCTGNPCQSTGTSSPVSTGHLPVLRGEPTESIDGSYHRNKTIKFWSNGITCLYRKYMVYPLEDSFSIENALLFV